MIAELNNCRNQAAQATELAQRAEGELYQMRIVIQAADNEKQILQQEVQNLLLLVNYFKDTTVKSMDEFLDRLKLNLNNALVGHGMQGVY